MTTNEAKKVAFLLADDFEDSEMLHAFEAISKNGHEAVIIGQARGTELQGKNRTIAYTTHLSIDEADPAEYDAVIIPGGESPANLTGDERVAEFIRRMDKDGKTIAAICRGPQLLVEARLLDGRNLTAYPELHIHIHDAGGRFFDKPVVVDENLITSRAPEDEPHFIQETINKLGSASY
ncbi:DJ-1/PfpI/YhbO family deglycase/protease [Paenibacillus humicola]|uniref:DJ-1/PfpI/YhbO family deglycase/protease n=1 Tax=Paenibacillus humicola TaxID=3110540 RepID=UPI00237BEF00|nr:DJ-1/PfpI/YhbO family deglycase/protease [Paenibacillus humicola]